MAIVNQQIKIKVEPIKALKLVTTQELLLNSLLMALKAVASIISPKEVAITVVATEIMDSIGTNSTLVTATMAETIEILTTTMEIQMDGKITEKGHTTTPSKTRTTMLIIIITIIITMEVNTIKIVSTRITNTATKATTSTISNRTLGFKVREKFCIKT
jgi:hypothetical protein